MNTVVNHTIVNRIADCLSGHSRSHTNIDTRNANIEESPVMNANNPIARIACFVSALAAAVGLLTLAGNAAQAQGKVLSYTDPYHATGLTQRQTEVQFLVFNSGTKNLTSLQIHAVLVLKGTPSGGLALNSSRFSLGAHQQKTISIVVPATATDGVSVLNREVVGVVNLLDFGNNSVDSTMLVDFVDKLPTADLVIDSFSLNTAPGYPVVTVKVKNSGTWSTDSVNDAADELQVEIYQNQEGKTLPDITSHTYFKNLAPGATSSYSFPATTWSALYGMMFAGSIWTQTDSRSIN